MEQNAMQVGGFDDSLKSNEKVLAEIRETLEVFLGQHYRKAGEYERIVIHKMRKSLLREYIDGNGSNAEHERSVLYSQFQNMSQAGQNEFALDIVGFASHSKVSTALDSAIDLLSMLGENSLLNVYLAIKDALANNAEHVDRRLHVLAEAIARAYNTDDILRFGLIKSLFVFVQKKELKKQHAVRVSLISAIGKMAIDGSMLAKYYLQEIAKSESSDVSELAIDELKLL